MTDAIPDRLRSELQTVPVKYSSVHLDRAEAAVQRLDEQAARLQVLLDRMRDDSTRSDQ